MKKTLEDFDFNQKTVLVRVDFNVPLDENGAIVDDTRIRLALPTIKYLLLKNARVVVCSHLGRPGGEPNPKFSLLPVAKYLVNELLGRVTFATDTVGPDAMEKLKSLNFGEVLLLENLRFNPGEESNDPIFANKLAQMADIFVNDAFGTAHRKHASTYGVAKLLPSCVGFLMGKEIEKICGVIENPERPLLAILGGAKVKDKIPLATYLVEKCDTVIIGGGMAFTFLKANGVKVGDSLVDNDNLNLAKEILDKAKRNNVSLILPIDYICASSFSPNAKGIKVKGDIPSGLQGLDIGPKTIKLFKKQIKNSKSIVWNGPLGVFEFDKFSKGTNAIAREIIKFKGKAVVGGGDSIAALNRNGNTNKIYHVSTGGGASLKLMAGESLPGVDVIEDKIL